MTLLQVLHLKILEGDYAGRLIEVVGLKGFRKGDMQWSDIHANFLSKS